MTPDQPPIAKPIRFCGEPVSSEQLALITQIVTRCRGLSRTELANTLCELFDWARPNGKLKTVECRQFLEQLQARTALSLPAIRNKGRGKSEKIALTDLSAEGELLQGTVKDFQPISLRLVSTAQERTMPIRLAQVGPLGTRSHACQTTPRPCWSSGFPLMRKPARYLERIRGGPDSSRVHPNLARSI